MTSYSRIPRRSHQLKSFHELASKSPQFSKGLSQKVARQKFSPDSWNVKKPFPRESPKAEFPPPYRQDLQKRFGALDWGEEWAQLERLQRLQWKAFQEYYRRSNYDLHPWDTPKLEPISHARVFDDYACIDCNGSNVRVFTKQYGGKGPEDPAHCWDCGAVWTWAELSGHGQLTPFVDAGRDAADLETEDHE